MGSIRLKNQSSPSNTPSSGSTDIFVDSSTKKLASKDDTGTVVHYETSAISSIADTDSVDLTVASDTLTADLKISADVASANNLKATTTVKTGAMPGLHVEIPYADTSNTGVLTNTDWNTFNNKPDSLDELSDVIITDPMIDETLRYNGSSWVNTPGGSVSAGPGIEFFLDDTNIYPGVNTLAKAPVTTTPEQTDSKAVSNTTALIEAYLYNTALGGTQIDGGVWNFETFAYVSANTGVSEILINACKVVAITGTITTTGTGTSRTATVTGSTPFVAGDANAAVDVAAYLQTPSGVFQITGYTSTSVVTISTLVGYVNESGVSGSLHRKLFQATTGEINTTSVTLYSTQSAQPAFPIDPTDKLAAHYFAKTTSAPSITISFTHNGNTHYSHFATPLITRHNDLAGLQGGSGGEYYHLTSAQHTIATQASGAGQAGYLSSTDWNTFNGKQNADADLTAISALATTGVVHRTAADTWAATDEVRLNSKTSDGSPVDGWIWYRSDLKELRVKIDGTVYKITVSPV